MTVKDKFLQPIGDLKAFYSKHERWAPLTFFSAGFLFDIVTLSRIDDLFGLIQQAVYLTIIGVILFLSLQGFIPQNEKAKKCWAFHDEALSFFLGSLLSLYTLFYFKASSLSTSFIFMLLLGVLLYLNEAKNLWGNSKIVPLILFFLCLDSYFIALVPIVTGVLGMLTFLSALLLSGLVCYPIYRLLAPKLIFIGSKTKTLWAPFAATQSLLIFLYFSALIPPVPLSLNFMGIYHELKKENGNYILSYTRPWWKFWQNGDQTFLARPNDKLYFYARVFSPGGLKEKLYVRWSMKGKYSWEPQDAIPIEINGGREEGFRGHTVKQNYSPGDWRVQIETGDGRELGRMSFTIIADTSTEERVMRQDIE